MKVDGEEIQKHEISYVEVITLLKQLAREQETLNDFLNELARRTRSFDDFIEKIGIWIELKPGREKQYFDSIIKKY